jgi:chromosome segregation ATPase
VQERRRYFMRLIDRLEKLPDDVLNLSQKTRQLRSDLEAATNDVIDMEKVVEKELSGQIAQWQDQMTSLGDKLVSEEAEIERLHRERDRTVSSLRRFDEERRDFELSLQKAQSDVSIMEKENRLQERLERLAESISARSAVQIERVSKLKTQISEYRQVDQECADKHEKAKRVVDELQGILKQIPEDRKKEKQRIKGIRRRLRERIASKEAEINHLVGQIAEREDMYKKRMRASVSSSQQSTRPVPGGMDDDEGDSDGGGDVNDKEQEGPSVRSRKAAQSSTTGASRDRRGLTLEVHSALFLVSFSFSCMLTCHICLCLVWW